MLFVRTRVSKQDDECAQEVRTVSHPLARLPHQMPQLLYVLGSTFCQLCKCRMFTEELEHLWQPVDIDQALYWVERLTYMVVFSGERKRQIVELISPSSFARVRLPFDRSRRQFLHQRSALCVSSSLA